jgi:hypothetical protein
MTWVQRCSVVPQAHASLARELSAKIAGPSGDGMWKARLPVSPVVPVSHYLSIGRMEDNFAGLLPLDVVSRDPNTGAYTITRVYAGQPSTVYALCQQAGVATTQVDVTALLTDVTVTASEPEQLYEVLTALGLTGETP